MGPGVTLRARSWSAVAVTLAGVAFLVLTILVVSGVAQDLEDQLIQWFRPNDVWGTPQARLGPIIDALAPSRMYAGLAVLGLMVSVIRTSVRPVLFVGTFAALSIVATMVTKFAVRRPDPHDEMSAIGGSYPSGHVVGVVFCFGCCVLLLFAHTRIWHWLPVAVVCVAMSAALLYGAAHWPSDVLGGALLATIVLAVASTTSLRQQPAR